VSAYFLSGGGGSIKIVVLGAGALGSLVGGRLAEAGCDVTLVGRRRHVEAIKERGLSIRGPGGMITVGVKATDDPTKIGDTDALILTTKTKDTLEALDSVSHLASSLEFSFSLQNGLNKDDHLADKFGSRKVIGAATTEGVTLTDYGEVVHTIAGITFFGALGGEDDARGVDNSEKMVRLFNNAGLRAEVVDDIRSAEWGKLIRMASGATLSILTRLEYHKILGNFDLAWCYVQLMRELAEIAKANGIILRDHTQMAVKSLVESPVEDAVRTIVQSGKKIESSGMTHVKISALQDIERGRKTELEELLGYPLSLAKKYNVNTPQLDFLYRLINGLDSYLL
jgi:2-dehydropantoate 2-reductase